MWVAVGIVFAIVAGTVSITLAITSSQIRGLERSQAQQSENILAIISGLEKSQAQQTEIILVQLRLLNDKMTNIETEHAELRTLYEKVGVLQAEVAYIRRDLDAVRANQDMMRADLDMMRADLDRVLKILETSDGN